MARQFYKEKNFRPTSLAMIHIARSIVAKYTAQGLRLTLRQLYYQFVAHHNLPNLEKSYKNLASLISDARLAGYIDWDAIEDRGRKPERASEFDSIEDLVNAALRAYRLPRWRDQPYYVELWVEKQALAGVLWPLAQQAHVTLMVNKGYSSQSAMHESAQRFIAEGDNKNRDSVLLYLGDHDPSGEDMVRDIEDRMMMFNVERLHVKKVALTMAQIKQYNPPPNPAKVTDSRARAYIAKFGNSSWEVDALDPSTLASLIRAEFAGLIDQTLMNAIKQEEEDDKQKLRDLVKENW